MLRILAYVVAVAVLVAGAVWLADRPGAVVVDWLGWQIQTSVPAVLLLLLLIAAALTFLLHLFDRVVRFPAEWAAERRERRRRKGYLALTDGLVAAATGEAKRAQELAGRAQKLLADPALTRFLSAQAAQLSGDPDAARRHYEAMLERPETAALGLRGLLDLALKRRDDAAAIDLANRARAVSPADPWLLDTLFALLMRADRLREAQELVDGALRKKALPPAEAARRRALVLNERATRAAADGDNKEATRLAREAVAADPELAAAALRLAKQHALAGRTRRAAATLEKAWARQPLPALARAYADLMPGEDPLQRLRRLEKLVRLRPDDPESHIVLGEASLDAKLWGQARRHLLAAAEARPSARVYHLLARLEQGEYNDQAAARNWVTKAAAAPADLTWVCRACGGTAADWSAMCPQCAAIDGLVWTPPHAPGEAPVTAPT